MESSELEAGGGLVVTGSVGAGVVLVGAGVVVASVEGAVVVVQLVVKGALVSKTVTFDVHVPLSEGRKHGAGVSAYVAFVVLGAGVDVMTADVGAGVEVGAGIEVVGHDPQHGSC